MPAKLHLAEDAFTLQFFLQRSQCLVDVVIANKYLHEAFPSLYRGAFGGRSIHLADIPT